VHLAHLWCRAGCESFLLSFRIAATDCADKYWVDFGFTRMDNQVSWRFPIAFQAFFATISIIGMFFLPDTPRWYYAKGRIEEGDSIVMRLHDRPFEDPAVQAMRDEILASIKLEDEDEHKFNPLDLIWDRSDIRAGRRIRISFLVLSIQQMMGMFLRYLSGSPNLVLTSALQESICLYTTRLSYSPKSASRPS
jgi:hypothetical protein